MTVMQGEADDQDIGTFVATPLPQPSLSPVPERGDDRASWAPSPDCRYRGLRLVLGRDHRQDHPAEQETRRPEERIGATPKKEPRQHGEAQEKAKQDFQRRHLEIHKQEIKQERQSILENR